MEPQQTKRNFIALLVGLVILVPLIFFYWKTEKGIFHYLNEADGKFEVEVHFPSAPHRNYENSQIWMKIADLSGSWHFAIGDDPQWADPDFDDSDWHSIHVPDMWESQGYDNYDGLAWYRREVILETGSLNHDFRLDLGLVDDVDEVFINGIRIGGHGGFPPTYESAWNSQRQYSIQDNVLREGRNLIAVRVYDAQQGGGIARGDVGLYASSLPRALVNLSGTWQFRTLGETPSDIVDVNVPQIWEEQGFKDYDGMAIYRKTFGPVDTAGHETLVLSLGKIDDTDEVHINGTLVGRTGSLRDSDRDVDKDYFRIERRYEFPATLLKDENVIEVKVHDSGGEGGIYEGAVGIYASDAAQ